MVITTGSAAAHITPTVVKTFFSHYYKRASRSSKDRGVQATDELIYDEAFHIVQKFCALATHDTVESIQNFTNTQIPTPPWALSIPVMVPLSSCHQAAEALIQYFGPEELQSIAGGEKWWQVRPKPGVPAEWIAQRDDWAKYEKEKHRHEPSVNSDGEHVFAEDDDADSLATDGTQSRRGKKKSRRPTKEEKRHQRRRTSTVGNEDEEAEDLNRLKRVMLYIHGGAYYWGSINTHRHQIIRFARKFGGRALAVNYRKAPDYPWPAPLHDCLAAYMYLIRPPPGASHPPIDPKKLVIAGDSAGGGLCLALLGVLRDTGIPMPAGAVLISPWCDMTHSFPSILQNTATDIVPPYGFIHKPSPLWPIPASASEPRSADPDDKPDSNGDSKTPELRAPQGVESGPENDDSGPTAAVAEVRSSKSKPEEPAQSSPKAAALKKRPSRFFGLGRRRDSRDAEDEDAHIPIPPGPKWLYSPPIKVPVSEEAIQRASEGKKHDPSGKIDFTGEVELKEEGEDGKRLGIFELKRQIQQYAANKQVFHPLCSPVMQGSLGGFPPLYILAGDAEVLRDEIIYLAHRAAHPKKYPLGEHLMTPRAREAAAKYDDVPTKVHFQLYDDQCHVLTVFAFTTQAKYAFRAIASFVKHVTGAKTSVLDMPFPRVLDGDKVASPTAGGDGESLLTLDSNDPPSAIGRTPEGESASQLDMASSGTLSGSKSEQASASQELEGKSPATGTKDRPTLSVRIEGKKTLEAAKQAVAQSPSATQGQILPGVPLTSSAQDLRKEPEPLTPASALSPRQQRLKEEKERKHTLRERKQKLIDISQKNEYDGQVPLMRPEYREFMIRERVDIRGQIRGMEEETQMQALKLKPSEIGVIKEGPCLRYMAGQKLWDRKFKRTVKKVERTRAQNEQKASKILRRAYKQGLLGEDAPIGKAGKDAKVSEWEDWLATTGPTTILKETPPPSAIVGRRDTVEAIQLLLLCLRARAKALDVHHAHLSGRPPRRTKSHRRSLSRGSRPASKHSRSSKHANGQEPEPSIGADGEAQDDDEDSSVEDEDEEERAQAGGKTHGLSAWNTVMSSLYRSRTTPKERREVKLRQRKSPGPSRPVSVAYEDESREAGPSAATGDGERSQRNVGSSSS